MLFVRKKRNEGSLTYQGYVEPKGNQFLEQGAWKETFSMQIENEHSVKGLFADDYKIIGFPFFNNANRMNDFDDAVDSWIENL